MMNIRISFKSSFLAPVALWICYRVLVYAETNDEWECWKENDPTTHKGAVCAIKYDLESMWASESRYMLEETTDLTPGEIHNIVPKLFLQWAECKYAAVVDFSVKRPDIPLRLLLAYQTSTRISDEEIIWLNQLSGFERHHGELEKCKSQWRDALLSYLPDSLYAE